MKAPVYRGSPTPQLDKLLEEADDLVWKSKLEEKKKAAKLLKFSMPELLDRALQATYEQEIMAAERWLDVFERFKYEI